MKKSIIKNICLAIMLATAAVENTFGADGVDQKLKEMRLWLQQQQQKKEKRQQKELNNKLFDAISQRCYEAVEYYLDRGADIKATQGLNQNTVLHCAVSSSWYFKEEGSIVELLIKRGAPIDQENVLGETPLYFLVKYAQISEVDPSLIKELIKNDANINHKDVRGWTPLHEATAYGELDMVRSLLDCDADINSQNREGKTPLHIAAMNPYASWSEWSEAALAKVNLLLDRGSDSRIRGVDGLKASDLAYNAGNDEFRDLLITHECMMDLNERRMKDRTTALFLGSDQFKEERIRSNKEFIPNILYDLGLDITGIVAELL